jgi:hypothetical protein
LGFLEATSVAVLVCVLVLIPISVGGLGLRQAGDIYLLWLFGVDVSVALDISLLGQLTGYFFSLLGGPFLLKSELTPAYRKWEVTPGKLRATRRPDPGQRLISGRT